MAFPLASGLVCAVEAAAESFADIRTNVSRSPSWETRDQQLSMNLPGFQTRLLRNPVSKIEQQPASQIRDNYYFYLWIFLFILWFCSLRKPQLIQGTSLSPRLKVVLKVMSKELNSTVSNNSVS